VAYFFGPPCILEHHCNDNIVHVLESSVRVAVWLAATSCFPVNFEMEWGAL